MKSEIEKAILEENLSEVKRLLVENPPIVDTVSEDGLPMSFVAAETGNLEVVKYIVEYSRASMNVTDKKHRNILHYGTMSGNPELVRYLVERVGMSPVSGDCDLITPYDIAHQSGFKEIEAFFEKMTGFAYAEAYRNPIRTGFYPDPSIVRVGDDYYMVNSSFIFFPCIPISHSRDLIHWKIIGYGITNP
ncbi:MAG: family 43 glycosylhydrolase, partial [Lachnospiraceae bacterium]|nr:family 43 glycosylhydrolase [Lachnospiraceae bacterium]